MKIHFERSGGFAGMRLATTLDSEMLSPAEARALQSEVEAAGFFDLPAKISGPGGGADRFQYRITLEASGKRHTVEVGEADIPVSLQPLVRHLTTLARSSRKS